VKRLNISKDTQYNKVRIQSIDRSIDGCRVTEITEWKINGTDQALPPRSAMKKIEMVRVDVDVGRTSYGFRIQLKSESACPIPDQSKPCSQVRIKDRTSFISSKFSFDCTIVRSGQTMESAQRSEPTYEVEIEALRNRELLNEGNSNSIIATNLLWKILILGLGVQPLQAELTISNNKTFVA